MGRSTEGYGSSFLSGCSPPNAWICGRFTGGRCTRNHGMPHTGVPKTEKVKMRKAPECSPHCGLLWIGGRRLQTPAFILQPNRRRTPAIWRRIRLGTRPRKAARFAAFSLWRVSSRFSAESSTRGHTGLTSGALACLGLSRPAG